MTITKEIPYCRTGQFSKLFLDYTENKQELREFFSFVPSVHSLQEVIKGKQQENTDRLTLSKTLLNQYKNTSTSQAVLNNISSLNNKNTFTITTGHQLSLFTGELYFIFKIISTIQLAKEAKNKYPEYNFVPVFWMASEDHDFAEINHIYLGEHQFEWNQNVSGATGKLSTSGLSKIIESLNLFLGDRPYTSELIKKFRNAYLNHTTLAQATRHLVNDLFADEGLVIIDADDSSLKSLLKDVMYEDIFHSKSFEKVNVQSLELRKKGFETQVNPREINFFYLADNYRERIISHETGFETTDGKYKFNRPELENEIQNYPERFSPNVVIRPLYQEIILPNLAYIGGPGELAYWLQLKSMFDDYKVQFPMIVWRNSFMIMKESDVSLIENLNLEIEDLFNSEIRLEEKITHNQTQHSLNLQSEKKLLEELIDSLRNSVKNVDASLINSIAGSEKKILNVMNRMEHKMLKAEKKKFNIEIEKIRKIKSKYFPSGKLQERKENFSMLYAEYGNNIIHTIKANTQVLKTDLTIISL